MELLLVHERSDRHKGLSDERISELPEERGAGQVDLEDEPPGIERAVPEGGEVVEIRVARGRLLQTLLGFSQLAVLHLELDLVNVKVVDEAFAIGFTRPRREPLLGALE